MRQKYLIVNADDCGIDVQINSGIMQCCRHGIVRSVSLLSVGRAFNDAVSQIKDIPGIGVGVHLCLVAEKPVLSADLLPSLVNSHGFFHPDYLQFIFRLWTGRINLHEVEQELEAQIKQVVAQGIKPTHLDSHQYVHWLPEILLIVIRLAVKYGLHWVRYPASLQDRSCHDPAGIAKRAWLAYYSGTQTRQMQENNISFPDRSYAVNTSGQLALRQLTAYLGNLQPGINDLTCHPGYVPVDGRYANWNYQWEQELATLTDPSVIDLLGSLDIRTGNYAFE